MATFKHIVFTSFGFLAQFAVDICVIVIFVYLAENLFRICLMESRVGVRQISHNFVQTRSANRRKWETARLSNKCYICWRQSLNRDVIKSNLLKVYLRGNYFGRIRCIVFLWKNKNCVTCLQNIDPGNR